MQCARAQRAQRRAGGARGAAQVRVIVWVRVLLSDELQLVALWVRVLLSDELLLAAPWSRG